MPPVPPRSPLEAVRGFSEQCLELTETVSEQDKLVFSHDAGVGQLLPDALTKLTEAFMPTLETELLTRGWQLTDGKVASLHTYWKTGHDPHVTIVNTQLRGQILDGVQHAVALNVHLTGVVDKEVEGIDITFGDIDSNGRFEAGPILTLIDEELSDLLTPDKSQAVTDLVDAVRSVCTLAEIHFEPTRQRRGAVEE